MENECCKQFNLELWHDKVIKWENKRFIKTTVKTFLYMPIGFGKAMTKLFGLVDKYSIKSDHICLSNHLSGWKMEILLDVDKSIPEIDNVVLNGTFYSLVYEGEFRETGKWLADFKTQLQTKNYDAKKIFMWYTTCPKCAKKYGKNYVAIIAQI